MNNSKAEEQLYLAKLLFEPNKDAEELNFPAMCKFVRHSFNVTQAIMAKRLGVNISAYQYWEQGKREPSAKAAANLCFLYLQCLYMEKQSPGGTEVKALIESLLSKNFSHTQKDKEPETVCAA